MTSSSPPGLPPQPGTTHSRWIRRILTGENGFILFFLLWCLFLSISTDNFLSSKNFMNILRQASITSIVAIGEMLVVLTGAMDVSLGALLGFCGVLSAGLMVAGLPPVLAGLAGVGAGIN